MKKTMKQKPSPKTVTLILIIFVIAVIAFFLYLGVVIPNQVKREFGAPSDSLSAISRLTYALDLNASKSVLTKPANTTSESQEFEIIPGESVSMMCLRLENQGLINDAAALRVYLIYKGMDRIIQAGLYRLSPAMTPIEIAQTFLDATPNEVVFAILPGWRIEEIAESLPTTGLMITPEEFLQAARNPSAELKFFVGINDLSTLEGFLYPGAYEVSREIDVNTLLKVVLSNFSVTVDQTILDGFAHNGLTLLEGVILASIVEKEAVMDEEQPMIASVFYNRLKINMKLETDPTVQYGLGYSPEWQSWWKSPLAFADYQVDSPYNTYIIQGFPPAPIANPSLSALRAVAFPAESPYYYFRARCDGSHLHNFAVTFEEHLENGCE